MEFNEQSPYEKYEQIEKKMFNTGPKASKTFPTQVNMGAYNAARNTLVEKREDFIDQNVLQPPATNNELSNLSATGSVSDREPETPNNKAGNAEKRTSRKRKRNDSKEISRAERKITEFLKTSPKRGGLAVNGDSSSNELNLVPFPSSPAPPMNNQVMNAATLNRFTPTHILQAYSSSDSNQSPPSASKIKSEVAVQTESACEPGKIEEDRPSDKYIEEISRLTRLNVECKTQLEIEKSRVKASKGTIKHLLVQQSTMQRKQAKAKCMEECLRIGQFKPIRQGEHFKDVWTDGYAFEEINKKLQKINNERNEIDLASRNLRKRKTAKESRRQADGTAPSTSITEDGFRIPEAPRELSTQECLEQEEIFKLRRDHLKKEELELLAEKDRLERERNLHIRELKRVQYEETSRFKDHELLNSRYLLLSLLGKGGFSEVWRAFDLDENRYVACKIHHVNKEWKEDKKANYVKHAMREKDIHKTLDHPRIVRLFDLFTIDNDSFCTVLEYCDGNDLDFYLKQHKQIPEKEARCIIMQVISALKYLCERRPPIIHYDLKPANILLQSGTTSGEIKITDFGLSKTMENSDDGDSIELTSQGAGTYWYLPPETFEPFSGTGGPPKISSKVDVWSVGVIFYQCIYGKRPFGHEQTQQKILEEKTILKATEVSFPSNPKVSSAAQDFIRRCLQYKKEERADVHELTRHDFFKPRSQQKLQPPSPSNRSLRAESIDEL
uniref:Protein kinase domain-containing protein n=1 Tax=Acrobeloides nanus TaxID=290746 RepID=A0A914DBN8_9BILA